MASQAIAENPGASNPQISKILGDRWAKESPEVKAQWKQRAEEESKRHRQQYPGYRFQPKRRGSKNYAPGKGHGDENLTERCPKCNGIRATQANTPATPARAATEELTPSAHSEPSSSGRRAVPMSAGGHVDRGSVRRSVRRLEEEGYRPESPEAKRRRLTHTAGGRGMMPIDVPAYDRRHPGYSNYTPSPAGYDAQGRYYRQTGTPILQHGELPRHHYASMPPPPRPAAWDSPGYQYPMRPVPGDESVRLPPLKTALTPTASPSGDLDSRHGYPITPATGLGISSARDSPEKSAQEQIMSISFSRKMSVVGKICPPLARATTESRGAIIAVEGPQRDILQYVSQVVEKTLQVCQDARLRSWSHDDKLSEAKSDSPDTELQDLMPSIFQEILGWHEKSKEMIRHVTDSNAKEASSPAKSTSPTTSKDDDVTTQASSGGEASGSATTQPEKANPASSSTSVALIKDGFSLTLSDRFACATSHSLQQYSPVDHWQWMATLWRGIVGPDLVVHVKPCQQEDMDKLKTVEYQKHLGVLVVRVPAGKSSLDEATERRLNFEVIEWIADVWPKMATRG